VLRSVRTGLVKLRMSCWIVLAAIVAGIAHITWRFIGVPEQQNRAPALLDLLGWMFWTAALAIVAIWACWKKTDQGWRWRWRRF